MPPVLEPKAKRKLEEVTSLKRNRAEEAQHQKAKISGSSLN